MKRIFPLVLVGLGLLLSVGALSWLYLNQVDEQVAEAAPDVASVPVPDELASLQRTEFKTGPVAIAEFEMLHGKEFPITTGGIGVYGNREATIWAAGTDSEAIASQMVDAMRDRIAEGNSPFMPLDEIQDSGRTVYVLEGMGQKHYYFQSKNLVIWLAADSALAGQALQQALEVYP